MYLFKRRAWLLDDRRRRVRAEERPLAGEHFAHLPQAGAQLIC
jgi:hypothetical protein